MIDTERSSTIRVTSNIKEVTKTLKRKEKKHIPDATRVALNETAKKLQKIYQIQTKQYLDNPTPFTQKGFAVQFARRNMLKASVFIKDIQAKYLSYQIDGGTMTNKGKKIPVPTKHRKLNQYGNIPGKRKGVVKGNQEIKTIGKTTGVFTKGKTPKLLIVFKDAINYTKKRFPFFAIGEKVVANVLPKEMKRLLKYYINKK